MLATITPTNCPLDRAPTEDPDVEVGSEVGVVTDVVGNEVGEDEPVGREEVDVVPDDVVGAGVDELEDVVEEVVEGDVVEAVEEEGDDDDDVEVVETVVDVVDDTVVDVGGVAGVVVVEVDVVVGGGGGGAVVDIVSPGSTSVGGYVEPPYVYNEFSGMLGPRYVIGKYTTVVEVTTSPAALVLVTAEGDSHGGYSCVGAAIGLQRAVLNSKSL